MSTDSVKVLSNEFLKGVMTDALVSRSFISDANATTSPGVYDTNDYTLNLPDGAYEFGTLSVFSGGYFSYQEYSTFQNPMHIFRRILDKNKKFGAWNQIT